MPLLLYSKWDACLFILYYWLFWLLSRLGFPYNWKWLVAVRYINFLHKIYHLLAVIFPRPIFITLPRQQWHVPSFGIGSWNFPPFFSWKSLLFLYTWCRHLDRNNNKLLFLMLFSWYDTIAIPLKHNDHYSYNYRSNIHCWRCTDRSWLIARNPPEEELVVVGLK